MGSVPPDLLGPFALLVAAIAVIGVLWKLHLEADADDRRQRDKAIELLEREQDSHRASQDIARDQAAATNRLADAWERRNKTDADRRRRGDPSQ